VGKSAPSPPQPPNPAKVAAAQTATNKATAETEARLDNVNQFGPWGSINFTETPSKFGPQWSMRTQLSPEQQKLYDLTTAGQTTYGTTANTLLSNTQDMLSKPISTNYDQYRNDAINANFSRLDPKFAQQEEGMRSRLLNQGIAPGSEAWANDYRSFNEGKNDAWLQALGQGGNVAGQALQQEAALRSVPLNEANALLSGGQVHAPQFQQTANTNVGATDVVGAYGNAYNAQMQNYNAQMSQQNATMGGLFGLAGTLGGALIKSDARLKTDIVRVGALPNGFPVYEFRYLWDHPETRHVGLMAQDILPVLPAAVHTDAAGYMSVDYGMAVNHGR